MESVMQRMQSEETAAKGVGNSTTLPKDVEKAEDAKKFYFLWQKVWERD